MIITHIDVFVLKTPLETPFAFSQGWVTQRSATLVRISTDTGLEGWGEAFCQGLEAPEIAAAAISHAFAPLLIGKNALNRSPLWYDMYNRSRDFGRKGSVIAALSALDVALWDLAGKHLNMSVSLLLGGVQRTRLQPYATGFYRLHGQGEAERLAEEAVAHHAAGFSAMKVKLGFGLHDDIEVMEAIRQALSGCDVQLMIDTNHAYGRRDALALGKALEDYDLRWYEEPVAPEDREGYAHLRQNLSIPIAGGENEHTAYGFAQLLRSDAVDIAQPDVGSCGGLTAAQHIIAMSQAMGVNVNPHVWGSAIAQAASVQLMATLPVTHHALFAQEPILEFDCSDHPFRQELVTTPLKVDNGIVVVPSGPGLGISVRMDTVDRFRTNV